MGKKPQFGTIITRDNAGNNAIGTVTYGGFGEGAPSASYGQYIQDGAFPRRKVR
jgi:hypothetical protein